MSPFFGTQVLLEQIAISSVTEPCYIHVLVGCHVTDLHTDNNMASQEKP